MTLGRHPDPEDNNLKPMNKVFILSEPLLGCKAGRVNSGVVDR
jgi:hypothetical protein